MSDVVPEQAAPRLDGIGQRVQQEFTAEKRVLSFAEYMSLVESNPRLHFRNSARYLVDMFDHYGCEQVQTPEGEVRRFKLFDVPWDSGEGALIGQERVQNSIYRILRNFVNQGRADRFILLHGPNGSSKSTVIDVISRAMEHYSALEGGALYRFNWVFPNQGVERSGIGFGPGKSGSQVKSTESYAHLDDTAVDARLPCEQRDHPLLLIPKELRIDMMKELCEKHDLNSFTLPRYLLDGDLSHKSKMIYEALLGAYEGDYLRVLRHVQVERFYISRRYRVGVDRVEPQLAVDARMQQITADRSLTALPSALQSVALYESGGQLVRSNRGLIDFADLLKRPIEAFKYLLTTVEDGRVSLEQANLYLDTVFMGSANETHLNALMQSPEWMSFKARMELVRVPYLLDFQREAKIYAQRITETEVRKPVSPHAIKVAALWAALTRMHRPQADRYQSPLKDIVAKLSPMDKARFYSEHRIPSSFSEDQVKTLRGALAKLYNETDADVVYEGRTGASPREVRTALMNAAQSSAVDCLAPEAVLDEIGKLVKETSIYDYLRQEPKSGYYDHAAFIDIVREWYLDRADSEVRQAMGLVEESRYAELFGRYVNNVTHYVRNEKIVNPITGQLDDADEKLMRDVEKRLDIDGSAEPFRQSIMTKIGAWSLDHRGQQPDYSEIFPDYFKLLRDKYFAEQRQRVERTLRHALLVLNDDAGSLSDDERDEVQQMLTRLEKEHQQCTTCARPLITELVKRRYS
jgi:serine protein kinase